MLFSSQKQNKCSHVTRSSSFPQLGISQWVFETFNVLKTGPDRPVQSVQLPTDDLLGLVPSSKPFSY